VNTKETKVTKAVRFADANIDESVFEKPQLWN